MAVGMEMFPVLRVQFHEFLGGRRIWPASPDGTPGWQGTGSGGPPNGERT